MEQEPSIRQLYPDLTEEQAAEAEDNVARYIAVMARIYTRVRAEQGPEAAFGLAHGDLTHSEQPSSIQTERSNFSKDN